MQTLVRNNGISDRRTKILLATAAYFMDTMIVEKKYKIKTFRYILDLSSKTGAGDYGYQTELMEVPGTYTIALAKEPQLKVAVEIAAHEFVHLDQSLSGRFKIVPTGKRRGQSEWFWEGESFGLDPYTRHSSRDSHIVHLPWETEAYDLQAEWAERCIKHMNASGVKGLRL